MSPSQNSDFEGFERGPIKHGFENVLKARLSDALFFYNEDLKTDPKIFADRLEHVVFHEKLGSMKQKVERLQRLAPNSNRAAELCKLDLVTQMVGEFDELQGLAGAEYARKRGEPDNVVAAIREHYKPAGQSDSLPSEAAVELALADKMDSLVGFLGIGIKPSSSKDPFALRRLAVGIIRIVEYYAELQTVGTAQTEHRSNELSNSLWLSDLFAAAVEAYKQQGIALRENVASTFQNFLYERLFFYLLEQRGARQDIVKCAIESHKQKGRLDICGVFTMVNALEEFVVADFFDDTMTLWTRLNGFLGNKCILSPQKNCVDEQRIDEPANFQRLGIYPATERADGRRHVAQAPSCTQRTAQDEQRIDEPANFRWPGINVELFETDEERLVYDAVKKVVTEFERCNSSNKDTILSKFRLLGGLRPSFEAFFKAVQVNTDKKDIANNRLSLLALCLDLYRGVADLSPIAKR
ncbi:MAG: glycine--tRNA ligase subunit beta [Holosporales bacterium]|nr:glycine--tRNA ligase subunit beta [Holosporales bacterium]